MKNVYYVSVFGKQPRKRKVELFERQCLSDNQADALSIAESIISEYKLRDAKAKMQLWGVDESNFIDSNGENQTIVFRNIFPSGNPIVLIQ